jgi:PAS domain S-box-containing protein
MGENDRKYGVKSDQLNALEKRIHASANPDPFLLEVFSGFASTLEELNVTLEELRLQNEELEVSRQMVDHERLRYQSLFDFAPDGYLVTDLEGVIEEANQTAVRMLGSKAHLSHKPLLAFITKEHHLKYVRLLLSIKGPQSEPIHETELMMRPRGLPPFPASIELSPIVDSEGKPVGIRWLLWDSSIRQQAEISRLELSRLEAEKQRLSNDYNRSLIEASLDPQVTISPSGKITDVNHATEEVTGLSRAELIGTDFSEYFTDPQRARAAYLRAFEGGGVRDYDLNIRHRDGHIIPVFYNVSVFKDASGMVIGVLATARDMSEHLAAEQKLRIQATALESAANGIFITDKNGIIQWSNPAFTRMTGYTAEEILGQNPRVLKSGRVDIQVYRQMWDTVLSGHVWQGDLVNRRKDGSFYDEEQTIAPVFGQNHEITHFVAIKQDVTQRKQAELQLRRSNAYNRSLIEASLDPLVTIAPDGKITDVNHAAELATGLDRAELLGTDFSEYFTEPDRARAGYLQAFREGQVHDYELALCHHSGRLIPVFYNASVVRDESGQVIGVFAAARDISERKRAERLLHEETIRAQVLAEVSHSLSEAGTSFQAVVDQAARKIVELTGDVCDLRLVSNEDEGMQTAAIGFPDEQPVPDSLKIAMDRVGHEFAESAVRDSQPVLVSDLASKMQSVSLTPEMQAAVRESGLACALFIPLLLQGRSFGVLSVYRNRSKPDFSQADQFLAQRLADRVVLAINNAHLYTDLEKSLATEQSLRNQIVQVEKFSAVGRMVASIAHEMNNPLQTVKNCLFLAKREVPPGDGHQYLDMASGEVQRISRLVSQLREVYRPRTAGMSQPVVISEILDDMSALMDPHLIREQVTLQRAPNEGKFVVDGISDQLKQVFLNICLNAIEAMQPNGGTLKITLATSPDSQQVGVIFKDSGPGIAPENLPRIFQPLFTTKEFGLGLGLSISFDIVQRHGGTMTVESEPGQGATFTVWLPLSAEGVLNHGSENTLTP